jgi:hypothetical protein
MTKIICPQKSYHKSEFIDKCRNMESPISLAHLTPFLHTWYHWKVLNDDALRVRVHLGGFIMFRLMAQELLNNIEQYYC